MPSLDSITFDTSGFDAQPDMAGRCRWSNTAGDVISLHYFATRPDVNANLDLIDKVRSRYRAVAISSGMGIIEVEVVQIDGCKAVRTILKAPQPSSAMAYLGSLTLPFRDFSYVISLQAMEQGITGMREAIVLDALMASGQFKANTIDDRRIGQRFKRWFNAIRHKPRTLGRIAGWMQDPYDSTIQTPIMRNLADDEQYDAQFTGHPLSHVRVMLRQVQPSIRLAAEVKNAPPYVFP